MPSSNELRRLERLPQLAEQPDQSYTHLVFQTDQSDAGGLPPTTQSLGLPPSDGLPPPDLRAMRTRPFLTTIEKRERL